MDGVAAIDEILGWNNEIATHPSPPVSMKNTLVDVKQRVAGYALGRWSERARGRDDGGRG
jgi:hypothetical protein